MRTFYLFLILFPFCALLEGKNCKVDVGFGYRRDAFQWEIAGPENKPPVLSRVSWRGLNMFEITADVKKITPQNIYIRANADVAWIVSGKNRDSDFRLNRKTKRSEEHSRSDNDGGKGTVWDGSIGGGLFMRGFFGKGDCFRWAPLVGYSIYQQNLRLFNGFRSIDLEYPRRAGHHIHHLNSTYDTTWHGPWVGADLYYHINDYLTASGALEYHWLRFNAKGDWNLRHEYSDDFHQEGNGQGVFGNFGLDYTFMNGWYMGAQVKGNYVWLNNGKDKISYEVEVTRKHHRPKTIEVDRQHKLRRVRWHSFSLLFTAGYNF